MKKALVLFALLAVSMAAHAQKITSASLQGTWLLEIVTDSEVILYPEERRGVLTDEGKDGLSAEEIKEEEASLAYEAADYVNSTMTFTGTTVNMVMDGEETLTGTFTLNTDGTILTVTDENGISDEAEVVFKDKKLEVYVPADEATYIFKKKQ